MEPYQILLMVALLWPDRSYPLGTSLLPEKFESVEACETARASASFVKQKEQIAEGIKKLTEKKPADEVWIADRCIQPKAASEPS